MKNLHTFMCMIAGAENFDFYMHTTASAFSEGTCGCDTPLHRF